MKRGGTQVKEPEHPEALRRRLSVMKHAYQMTALKHEVAVMEQPEDLGATNNERIPRHWLAAMWQFHQFEDLLKEEGVTTVALLSLILGLRHLSPPVCS